MTTDQSQKLASLRVSGKQTEGMRTDIRVRQFNLVIDEPESLGGTDTGANPMEYVLAGLAGCASVMLRMIAREQGLEYESASFDIRGTLDLRGLEGVPGVRRHFQTVTGKVEVVTSDGDKLQKVAEAIEDRCPAYNMLKDAGVDIKLDWIAVAK
ncbi:MAG: OsmC family protein [Firmicutes bacterium]|jgi:uncharacterized OsmC-like protein|nr:OsmC family protein [Bacillota bacterium]